MVHEAQNMNRRSGRRWPMRPKKRWRITRHVPVTDEATRAGVALEELHPSARSRRSASRRLKPGQVKRLTPGRLRTQDPATLMIVWKSGRPSLANHKVLWLWSVGCRDQHYCVAYSPSRAPVPTAFLALRPRAPCHWRPSCSEYRSAPPRNTDGIAERHDAPWRRSPPRRAFRDDSRGLVGCVEAATVN